MKLQKQWMDSRGGSGCPSFGRFLVVLVSRKTFEFSVCAKSYSCIQVADYWEQVIIMNVVKRRFQRIVQALYNTVSDKK
jgi:hypothetical protein